MITPRKTSLYRTADLAAFQRAIRALADDPDLARVRDCVVIVPSVAAADQLRRTFENHVLRAGASSDRALCFPHIVTRAGWYDELHSRMPSPPRRLGDLDREVLLKAAARDTEGEQGDSPFRLRAGLLVHMLALYDDLRRRNASIDTFERRIAGDLERDADSDRGAQRLMRQTRFLAATFRRYESSLADSGGVDEHALRGQLVGAASLRPVRRVIVTVGDRWVDPAGLWPADLELLTQLPLLEHVDIVATRGALAAGLFDRLDKLMPGFEEGTVPEDEGRESRGPKLATREGGPVTVSRDREDELAMVARTVKRMGASPATSLDRKAVVFKRPLPYIYLVRDVFADAGVPYQTFDALPLAAEPYAAALDLVFEFVTSGFTREPVVALLSSPHFRFVEDEKPIGRFEVASLNRALNDAGYFGGLTHLRDFAAGETGRAARAARAAAAAAGELTLLTESTRPSSQLGALLAFLAAHDRPPASADPLRERHLRARRAILSAIRGLQRAHERLDDAPVELADMAAMIRRWIEGQTFAPREGVSGVQVLDAQAARYGEFDEIFLVGLVEGEWPERPAKNIFFPASLLSQLDWPDSRAMLTGERAAFRDLLRLPSERVHLSTFELESDSIIGPSVFLEEVERAGLEPLELPRDTPARLFVSEGLTRDPVAREAVGGEAASWLALREGRSDWLESRFHGEASPYRPEAYTVSSLERYLECPFRFFSERVLKLEEELEDDVSMTPRDLGIFVHRVFEAFFDEWSRLGNRNITSGNLAEARTVFRQTVQPLLEALPDDEAAVQRTRLLGSAVDEGLAEAVFQTEAQWPTPVVARLLEHELTGDFEIDDEGSGRRVSLRGKADRIDLLADGTFRIIDYKLTRAPDRKLALQLPIYSVCAAQNLKGVRGQTWEPGQAGYIAFGADRRFVPMLSRNKDMDETLKDAQTRLLAAIDAIERGEFPPRPEDTHLCTRCAYAAVCRKDYVGGV